MRRFEGEREQTVACRQLRAPSSKQVTVVIPTYNRPDALQRCLAQVERGRQLVPQARLVRADVTEVGFESASFDAVAALFLLGHVPRAKQQALVERIFGWLRPGGWFLGTLGTAGADDEVVDWLGAPMFFASFDEAWNRRALRGAGFVLEDARVVPFEEPGHGLVSLVSFMWALARKPG